MTPELRALNEAAYAAAKAARKLGDPLASELTQLARRTDEMVTASRRARRMRCHHDRSCEASAGKRRPKRR